MKSWVSGQYSELCDALHSLMPISLCIASQSPYSDIPISIYIYILAPINLLTGSNTLSNAKQYGVAPQIGNHYRRKPLKCKTIRRGTPDREPL
jgi:hypothetical protein